LSWRWKWSGQDSSYVTHLNHLLQRLCEADVDFVIVGGFAAMLHGSSTGVGDYAQVRANSSEVSLFGQRVRVIAVEDLIKSKQALGRDKDLLAVKELLAILEKTGAK
jgi:predicted nucleotidyltransferase